MFQWTWLYFFAAYIEWWYATSYRDFKAPTVVRKYLNDTFRSSKGSVYNFGTWKHCLSLLGWLESSKLIFDSDSSTRTAMATLYIVVRLFYISETYPARTTLPGPSLSQITSHCFRSLSLKLLPNLLLAATAMLNSIDSRWIFTPVRGVKMTYSWTNCVLCNLPLNNIDLICTKSTK